MMKYIDIPWASMGYFDEDVTVDLIVHTTNDSFTIYNVSTDVSFGEDWLTCEVGPDRPRRGIYFPAKDVVYLEIVPRPTYRPMFGDDNATTI